MIGVKHIPPPLVGEGQGGGGTPTISVILVCSDGLQERSFSAAECDRRGTGSLASDSPPSIGWPPFSTPSSHRSVHRGLRVFRPEIGYRIGRRPARNPDGGGQPANLVAGEPRVFGITILERRRASQHGRCAPHGPKCCSNWNARPRIEITPPPQPSPTLGGGSEVAVSGRILARQFPFPLWGRVRAEG